MLNSGGSSAKDGKKSSTITNLELRNKFVHDCTCKFDCLQAGEEALKEKYAEAEVKND